MTFYSFIGLKIFASCLIFAGSGAIGGMWADLNGKKNWARFFTYVIGFSLVFGLSGILFSIWSL